VGGRKIGLERVKCSAMVSPLKDKLPFTLTEVMFWVFGFIFEVLLMKLVLLLEQVKMLV
jgi:hypothetical protein